jgi:hypothetical protein
VDNGFVELVLPRSFDEVGKLASAARRWQVGKFAGRVGLRETSLFRSFTGSVKARGFLN